MKLKTERMVGETAVSPLPTLTAHGQVRLQYQGKALH